MKLTPARRRGLDVLSAAERIKATTRVSNVTSAARSCVYWQVAYWLRDNGLARILGADTGITIELTDQGRQAAAELDRSAT